MSHHDEHEEIMVLGHDPVPGYRPVFWAAIITGVLYLAVILISTWSETMPGGH